MCGIAGIVSFGETPLAKERWQNFVDPLKYRGPDDQGQWYHKDQQADVILFHTRLSIIDLTPTGHQPMTSGSGNTVIVFNGEIYNFKSLRIELITAGFSFKSGSDTEVLLNGYEYWGMDKLLEKIDGMFAFFFI